MVTRGARLRASIESGLMVVLLLLGCGLLSACGGAPGPIQTGSLSGPPGSDPGTGAVAPRRVPAKVALIVTLSGDAQAAELGRAMRRAAELALFASETSTVELMVKDDRGTPEGARAAAEDAVRSGAELILGPLFAGSVAAVRPVAAQAGTPVIAFSSDIRLAGNGVFLLSFLATQEVPRVVEHATGRGLRNIAALLPDDAYGQVLEQSLKAALARGGANLSFVQRYAPETGGQEAAKILAEAIKGSEQTDQRVDAVFLPAVGVGLAKVSGLAGDIGVGHHRVKVLGTGAWAHASTGVDRNLAGALFAVPDPAGWREFSDRYAKSYGQAPPRLASLAHDAVSVSIALAGGAAGQRFNAGAMTRLSGFTGVDGAFRFLPDGTSERALAVIELGEQGQVIVDAAPSAAGGSRSVMVAPLPPVN